MSTIVTVESRWRFRRLIVCKLYLPQPLPPVTAAAVDSKAACLLIVVEPLACGDLCLVLVSLVLSIFAIFR